MKLCSLFDGIGGWLLAAQRNGIEPVSASEIEPFPIAVTKHRFPGVRHLGSVTDIDGAAIEPVDIITSGSPCQDLSIAGKRKGLDGERSNLFFESVRVVREMQAATGGQYPRFFVWENVPGAFSSNGGRDFLAVLEALTEANIPMPASGRWANAGMVRSRVCDCAWRTLDAQYWGVPQRRKRIFLVADFRAVGERRPEVFFESEGVLGHPPQGGETGQGAAEAVAGCPAVAIRERNGCEGGGKGLLYGDDMSHTLATSNDQFVLNDQGGSIMDVGTKAATLRAQSHGHLPIVAGFNPQASVSQGISYCEEKAPTIGCTKNVGIAYSFDSLASNSMKSSNPNSGCREVDVSKTLDTSYPDPSKNQGGMAVLSYDMTHANDVIRENCNAVNTLQSRMGTGGNQVPVVVGTLMARDFKGLSVDDCNGKAVPSSHGVRRLTPLECERLQGLPDGWTDIPHKTCSDSARYKAIGNGMAQPCADFVMSVIRRMAQ